MTESLFFKDQTANSFTWRHNESALTDSLKNFINQTIILDFIIYFRHKSIKLANIIYVLFTKYGIYAEEK